MNNNKNKKIFILYPCGKKFEIRIPITIVDNDGYTTVILPSNENYLLYAQKKFQINNLKVIEEEIKISANKVETDFISLAKKKRAVD